MNKTEIKDEIGTVICQFCEKNKNNACSVYSCKQLRIYEEQLYQLFRELKIRQDN